MDNNIEKEISILSKWASRPAVDDPLIATLRGTGFSKDYSNSIFISSPPPEQPAAVEALSIASLRRALADTNNQQANFSVFPPSSTWEYNFVTDSTSSSIITEEAIQRRYRGELAAGVTGTALPAVIFDEFNEEAPF